MNIDKTKAQMKKGLLEMVILNIIEKGEAYASDIIQSLKEADLLVVEGTLYPLLTRLKNEGMLEYRWEESKSGPPRKYYTITEIGRKTAGELVEGWQEMVAAIDLIIKKN
jgi:PadR family transcriptional regulator PadR